MAKSIATILVAIDLHSELVRPALFNAELFYKLLGLHHVAELFVVSLLVEAEDCALYDLLALIDDARDVVPGLALLWTLLSIVELDGVARVVTVAIVERHTLNLVVDRLHNFYEGLAIVV